MLGGEAALSVEARFLEPDLPDELDEAYAQTFDRLRRMFRARGCSAEESADLAQEAAVRAYVHIRRWGVTGSGLDPLLNRIARNLLIDRYRRVAPHLVSLDTADEIHDPTQDPTEEVARRQRRSAVHSAIRALPARHQKAIEFSLSGLSPEEVGKQLGIGRNAADALLHRARRSLREHLAPVRDGMWGLAMAMKIRWDRMTRRAGVDVADTSVVVASQSAIGVATAAIVAVLAVTGGGGSGVSAYAGSRSGAAVTVSKAVVRGPGATASRLSSVGGGPSGIGGSGRSAWSLGGVAGGSIGRDGTDTQVNGPRDPKSGQPIIWLRQHQYGKDEPAGDPVGQTLDVLCGARAIPCDVLEGP